jgi:hypothetical protein
VLLSSEWKPADALPAEYRAALAPALEEVNRSLLPVSNRECFAQLGELLVWADMFGLVKMPDEKRELTQKTAALCRMYWESLGDLPADLLTLALRRTRNGHAYSKLPLPADIRGYITEELCRRQLMAMRLKTAIILGNFEEPPLTKRERITPEQAAEVRATVQACRKALVGLVEQVNLGDLDGFKPRAAE